MASCSSSASSRPVDSRQVHGEAWARAIADLEDLSAQSCARHRLDGFPDRADRRLSIIVVLVILRHGRRRLTSLSITDHPTADWIARQLTDAFPWDEAPDYMIRDRDGRYGLAVTKRLAALGIRDHPTAARSPWQNRHAETLIGSIRGECLDHIVVFGEAHLRQILVAYAGYYNEQRTHLSLSKDSPCHRPVKRIGQVAAQPILGGLHHQYGRMQFSVRARARRQEGLRPARPHLRGALNRQSRSALRREPPLLGVRHLWLAGVASLASHALCPMCDLRGVRPAGPTRPFGGCRGQANA